MDVDAVLRRAPAVALVDELAHTNVPGSRHAKRWQDVEELLDAGIDVITTVNIQHLESVNDVVEKITGVPQRETVPDAVVRAADQIELCDMSGEALRRRLAHGNVYAPEKIDAALANYFRLGNLNALREIALLWTADRVDDALQAYRDQHEITGTWETRERVVVALTGGPEGEALIRRAARIAARARAASCWPCTSRSPTGWPVVSQAMRWASSDGWWSRSAAATTRCSATTWPRRCSPSRGRRTPPSWCSGTAAGHGSRRCSPARGSGRRRSAARGDIDVHIVTHDTGRCRPAAPSSRRR